MNPHDLRNLVGRVVVIVDQTAGPRVLGRVVGRITEVHDDGTFSVVPDSMISGWTPVDTLAPES